MKAVVIYESLTGNTRRAAGHIGDHLAAAGVETTVCPITNIDYAALGAADLVVIGSWTDGIFVVGQRPGRAARLRKLLPAMNGKRAVVFCTYALDCGHTLEKLTRLVQEHGAEVVGGMAIRRDRVDEMVPEFVDRVLNAVSTAP
jgi:menaquinone-dependent protoporphyrinogen IX oxidase